MADRPRDRVPGQGAIVGAGNARGGCGVLAAAVAVGLPLDDLFRQMDQHPFCPGIPHFVVIKVVLQALSSSEIRLLRKFADMLSCFR